MHSGPVFSKNLSSIEHRARYKEARPDVNETRRGTTKARYLQSVVLLACQHDEFSAAAIFIER